MDAPPRNKKHLHSRRAGNKPPDRRNDASRTGNVIQYPAPRIGKKAAQQKGHVLSQMKKTTVPISDPIDLHEEERTIITAVLHGDLSEFEILVRRYQKPVYHFMLRATRQSMTAEDLTQDTFARAYEKLHTFKRRKRFFPWLYTIAVNVCRDYLRRLGLSKDLFVESDGDALHAQSSQGTCANNAECLLELERVAAQVELLPLRYSEPMLLYYREGFSVKEISRALGISRAAVKVRIYRGRKKLKNQLGVTNERN